MKNTMNTKEALEIVLDLANQNALDERDVGGDEDLKVEYMIQQQALEKIQQLLTDLGKDLDDVV